MVSISLDFTIVWQFLAFLAIMWALNIVLFKPVRNILKKRAEVVAQFKSDISLSQEAGKTSQNALVAKQTETKAAGMALWEELKSQARTEELAKLQEANQANAKLLAEQRGALSAQIEMAGAKLDHEVEQFARDIAGKLLQRSLS